MSLVLSLQGCMAVGKTTAARYAQSRLPSFFVSYENPVPVFAEVTRRGLPQDTPEGFAACQRLFIAAEISRYAEAKRHRAVLLDLGAEEIEFYTLFYPSSLGFDWDMERLLKPELTALRQCRADHILYLDADTGILKARRDSDNDRRRGFFDHFINTMAANKRRFFETLPNVEFLDTTGMTAFETGEAVVRWASFFI